MSEETLSRVIKKIDVIAATAGIFLGVLIICLYYLVGLHQQDIGFTILLASSIYLFLRNNLKKVTFIPLSITFTEKLTLNISFFLIFSITLLIWYKHLYFRPLSYFILVSVLAGIIAVEVLCLKEEDSVWQTLLKIFLLSANIRAGIFYNFPSLMGYDAYWHAKIAELITNTGFVPPFEISNKYFYYPLAHIFVSITQIMIQEDIKDAMFCSIGLLSIISTIFIYLIGKKLAEPQVGLLATLLANITNFFIIRGVANITPGSLVLCYFMLVLYLVFKKEHKVVNMLIIIFITLLMVITHQLTTFVVFISLTSIYLGRIVYKYMYGSNESPFNLTVLYLLSFAITLQSYWMYTYVYPTTSFFEFVLRPFIRALQSGGEYDRNLLIVGDVYNKPMLEILFVHSHYLILPFFAIGGILFWLSMKEDKKFSIVTAVIVLYLFIYGVPLLGMRNMLTSRWMPLLSVFLVIIASSYIFNIVAVIRSNKNKIFAIFTIAVIFSFLMITTPAINRDNPIMAKDMTIRNQFKYNEMCAVKTINNIYNGTIRADYSYGGSLFRQMGVESKFKPFNTEYVASQAQEEENGTLVILRRCSLAEPISIIIRGAPPGIVKQQTLPKEFFERFKKSTKYDLVYNNGEVFGYISK